MKNKFLLKNIDLTKIKLVLLVIRLFVAIHVNVFILQGYLLNWDVQKNIWDYVFGKDVFNLNSNTTVVLTEPILNFTSIQEATSEVFFEEYEVEALLRINGESSTC